VVADQEEEDCRALSPGGQAACSVKVVNTSFGMSCLWPVSKLKEKLVKLRKLIYAVRIYNFFSASLLCQYSVCAIGA